ncbi:MAG: DEAD/DEAH box helicase [Desulfobacteraceae bacterium]|nr:DEAD/DEAH box helicase [Desulfobacteraceae bacterium]
MRPGASKSLKNIFKKIGTPDSKKFIPDPFQIKAVEAIKKSDCLVAAPTGAGKTWIAEKAAEHIVSNGGRVWYGTPLKALTNSIYSQFSKLFGKDSVGILTGDIKENADANIVIGTTEILRNQLYDSMHTGKNLDCDLIILDEAHYLGDEDRGVVWEEIMIYLPSRVPLLLLSATIGNPYQIAGWLESIRTRKCKVIESSKRPVPLHPVFFHPSGTLFPLLQGNQPKSPRPHRMVLDFLKTKYKPQIAQPGKLPIFSDLLRVLDRYNLLPVIFFLKSRADCDQAIKLCNEEIISKHPEQQQKLKTRIAELVSGNTHLAEHNQRETLENTAAGAHHSGHLPAWKVVIETLMAEGLLNAMFATSTVAAGVNFPARSVAILNSDRFNGTDFVSLTPSEFQQMTGRAGRRGMDNIGFGLLLPGQFMNLRYVAKLINSPPIDIQSQIKIDFSMVLNLLLSHSPEEIHQLLEKSFASYLLTNGKKRGEQARTQFGAGLEYLWQDFLAHMDFLKHEKFITKTGELTEDGLWASSLRIDAPLMVAQSLRENLLPDSSPAMLAGIMGAFVNERQFKDDKVPGETVPDNLLSTFATLRKKLQPFALNMKKKGFPAPNLYIQPAVSLYGWALYEPWESVTARTDFAEGDLARLILRTAENLRHLTKLKDTFPKIAQSAEKAIEMILKEPVFTWNK